jgi:Protein of unknown function (DUF2867)
MMTPVNRGDIPQRARELAALDRIDYADCFSVELSGERSPEEWVRLAADGMPALFSVVRVAHRALGLHLGPADSPDHVIGWDVLRSDQYEAVLGNAGMLGTPRIVGLTSQGQVTIATLIKLNGLIGRTMWAAAAPLHRAVARYVLSRLPTLAAHPT